MGFFLTIIVLFFFVVILILSIAWGFLRSLFGFGRRNSQQQTDTFSDNNPIDKQKIFDKNEGEYVDFEEMKE